MKNSCLALTLVAMGICLLGGVVRAENVGVIYDGTDDGLGVLLDTYDFSEPASNLEEAANAAGYLVGTNGKKCLEVVILAGHGSPGLLGLGSGESSEYDEEKDLKAHVLIEPAEEFLTVLSEVLCEPNGHVILVGCKTGRGEGRHLVRQLSELLSQNGVIVSANRECVGLTEHDRDDEKAKSKNRHTTCVFEGESKSPGYWKPSSTVAAQNGHIVTDPEEIKTILGTVNGSCIHDYSG